MKAQFLIYLLNNQINIKKKNQLAIRNNSLNWIKIKEINLNKYTKYIQFDGKKKSRVNKYILVRLQVEEEKNSAKEPYDGY